MRATMPNAMSEASPASQANLPARIRWLCQLIRIAALLWVGWILVNVARGWYAADPARLMDNLNRGLNAGVSEISKGQIAAFFTGNFGIWLLDTVIAYCMWTFTVDAALWMRRLGVTGLITVLGMVAWRRVSLLIFTMHGNMPAGTVLLSGQWVTPPDLMRLLFCLFLVALAHIFKAAAELADDHAGIV
jgi:hypothetical protein